MWALVWLAACGVVNAVNEVKDKVQGATDPMVAQGLILGVEEPTDPELAAVLDAAGREPGTEATLFLAEEVTGGAGGPWTGARASLESDVEVEFVEVEDGLYRIEAGAGPDYQVGASWSVEVAGTEPARVATTLPDAADVVVPQLHPAMADLVLDLTGQGFSSVLVVVIDGLGTVTWTNAPEDAASAIELAGRGEDLEVFTIPGVEAFPTEAIYAVGVAGLTNNEAQDVENLNTLVSGLQAGKLRWFATSTVPVP